MGACDAEFLERHEMLEALSGCVQLDREIR